MDIFEYVDSGKGICHTSAINAQNYIDTFSKYSSDYDAVISFHISSEMSVCYANACIAAEELGNVYVIDSRNLSTGIGHLVLDAAIMAQEGKLSPQEIVDIINAVSYTHLDVYKRQFKRQLKGQGLRYPHK